MFTCVLNKLALLEFNITYYLIMALINIITIFKLVPHTFLSKSYIFVLVDSNISKNLLHEIVAIVTSFREK